MIDEIKKAIVTAPIILAEKDETTREVLKDQMLREQLTDFTTVTSFLAV